MITKNIYFVNNDSAYLLCGDKKILLDVDDVDRVSNYQWSIGRHGYVTTGSGDKQLLLHRLILNAPKDKIVDHINMNKLDNRKCNLRLCNVSENCMNKNKLNSNNKYKGVCKTIDGNWQSQVSYKNQTYYLGRYETEEEAAKAYDCACRKLCGEFAKLNFPNNYEYKMAKVNNNRKLSVNDVLLIRQMYMEGYSVKDLSKIFSHSYSSILRCIKNKTYKMVRDNE